MARVSTTRHAARQAKVGLRCVSDTDGTTHRHGIVTDYRAPRGQVCQGGRKPHSACTFAFQRHTDYSHVSPFSL